MSMRFFTETRWCGVSKHEKLPFDKNESRRAGQWTLTEPNCRCACEVWGISAEKVARISGIYVME
ncbi:hypothetical protein M404DRAFT_383954 [Pisolithus tinctorius Marx 270]|uniref:Uncharacterized protein n=1 Tax=Pisolithus tinctorius Marx 270 TaxID=870435 RepID=A0A0C3MZY7_PISTI|nr:hypothetical protein M404DRAFT_383954 [Pisolithus tinctorius Marx 270]